jgi:hypothetical protein
MVSCSFCKKKGESGEGHNLRSCKREGVEAYQEERAKDPKIIQQREKAKAKKAEKNKAERERLGVTRQSKGLYQPSIKLGILKEEYKEQCQSVRGAIEMVMSKEYLLKILAIINNNWEKHIIKMATNEAKNVDYPIEVVTVTDSEEEEEGEPRKGTVGSLERRKKMKKVRRRVSGRQLSLIQRKHSKHPLYHKPFDFEELMVFFGILVYGGTETVASWKDTGHKAETVPSMA